ncbi:prenyltransferase/squalene oxidase repeat-containing protein [Catellatospora tritici]|uniref:prenyltransferase/squalene oxidase repeat-containing protein n=1 Tax=Catellatospora tritici TaxID=2851566 RepID=UPI001C2D551C|nr:prenyltransferase/squalene oxidase repeat-containing protein [Catellatospora tritici]MBV1853831.1 terpene cyclase/mutase family protein [Catellatospora tritici]
MSPLHPPGRRVRRIGAGLAIALATLLVTAVPAAASPTLNRADAAAGWLARQLVDGERFEVVFDGVAYPDQGLTIDAVFAFAASKTGGTYRDAAMAWLAEPGTLTGYVGDGTEAYAGATAKLALAAEVTGADPAAFGGVDLITRLRGLQAPSGRFSDRSAWGDFSNGFTQSLAVIALGRTAAGAPAASVSYLAGTACADGGFPLYFDQPVCVSDVDATALAVQALRAAGDLTHANSGASWLVAQQQSDGGFASAGVENANSTGLAAQALQSSGRLVAAAKARVFLRGLQVGCAGAVADRGAISYTTGVFDPATGPRATAQAVLGLTGRGYANLDAAGSVATAPTLACP